MKARATFPVVLEGEEPQLSIVELVAATIHAITLNDVDAQINGANRVEVSG